MMVNFLYPMLYRPNFTIHPSSERFPTGLIEHTAFANWIQVASNRDGQEAYGRHGIKCMALIDNFEPEIVVEAACQLYPESLL